MVPRSSLVLDAGLGRLAETGCRQKHASPERETDIETYSTNYGYTKQRRDRRDDSDSRSQSRSKDYGLAFSNRTVQMSCRVMYQPRILLSCPCRRLLGYNHDETYSCRPPPFDHSSLSLCQLQPICFFVLTSRDCRASTSYQDIDTYRPFASLHQALLDSEADRYQAHVLGFVDQFDTPVAKSSAKSFEHPLYRPSRSLLER